MKTLIFDLDGVICHTDEYHYRAWKSISNELEIPFDREVNNRLRGVSRKESLEIILENYEGSLTEAEKESLLSKKNTYYKQLLEEMTPESLSPEVYETLVELRKRRYQLAIGSSSKNAPIILEKIGLGKFFDAVSDGNQISRSKPDPEVFLKAAQLLNSQPEECTVIEDAITGAAAGHVAKMKVICVGDAARKKAGDYNLEVFKELLDILK